MTVTMMPKAPVQPYLRGARLFTPRWMKSKSKHQRVRGEDHDEDADDDAERDVEAADVQLDAPEAPGVTAGTAEDHDEDVDDREDQVADEGDKEDLRRASRRADLAAGEQGEG